MRMTITAACAVLATPVVFRTRLLSAAGYGMLTYCLDFFHVSFLTPRFPLCTGTAHEDGGQGTSST